MASFFRYSRRLILFPYEIIFGYHRITSADSKKLIPNSLLQIRPYFSMMHLAAFQNNMLRYIRQEIDYNLDNFPLRPKQEFDSFNVDARPGEQFLIFKRKFNDENIKIEADMLRGSNPVVIESRKNVPPNVACVISIQKDGDDNVLQFLCTVWEHELQINQVFVSKVGINPIHVYNGPKFSDMEDDLQAALYVHLESRGIDDNLAFFMFVWVKYKVAYEFVEWLRSIKKFVENKMDEEKKSI